ncbi:MAG: hypothetical protein Q8S73_41190 [Deltaproteobacteria bacterium]|nr:hypothetical protein [Myxococcales bacterium]MDP3220576.1 hypothetical protein [Deltaproteobacteria bacterium]
MRASVKRMQPHRQWMYTALAPAGALGCLDAAHDGVRAVAIVVAIVAFLALLATEPRTDGWA